MIEQAREIKAAAQIAASDHLGVRGEHGFDETALSSVSASASTAAAFRATTLQRPAIGSQHFVDERVELDESVARFGALLRRHFLPAGGRGARRIRDGVRT